MAKKSKTPSFLLEVPLRVTSQQARHLRAHLEAARCFYNAVLGEACQRLKRMRADPDWEQARAIPRLQKHARKHAFAALREQYGFSEYALHGYAKTARCTWIAEHLDSTMAQTLATRAYQAAQRVCVGKARAVRFKSRGRGLDSVEGKRNDTGMRFVVQQPTEGNQGYLFWGADQIPALLDRDDPVVAHGLRQRIKYARLVRRKASSGRAKGADATGHRYFVQLTLEGQPFLKPKNRPGADTLGLDLGPSTLAVVPRQGTPRLLTLAEEVRLDARQQRRLQRKLDRQRRANNPQNYDERGRIKRQGKRRLQWHDSQGYQETRRQLAGEAQRLAAQRKSLHGRLVNELIQVGNTITLEKLSYRGWQKRYGKSVGLRAPGMFVEHLKRTVAKTGGIFTEVSTYHTKLSQYCHGCHTYHKKPLSQRWHQCPCGVGPVQRDLYSAFLAAYLEPKTTIPFITQSDWAGAEARLMAVMECLSQRATAGQSLPQTFGLTRGGARRRVCCHPTKSRWLVLWASYRKRWDWPQNPLCFSRGSFQSLSFFPREDKAARDRPRWANWSPGLPTCIRKASNARRAAPKLAASTPN